MHKSILFVALTVGFAAPLYAAPNVSARVSAAQDEAQIRELQQVAAWNRHNAVAYANLFTEDGDVVNVVGWWWKDLLFFPSGEIPDHFRFQTFS